MRTTILALLLAAGPALAADVNLAGCPAAPDGKQVCVPVKLSSGGQRVASAGVTIAYDTVALRLPGGSADVHKGSALSAGQGLSASVSEDPNAGSGQVKVTVTPPVSVPIALIDDGTIAEVCFTAPAGSVGGCESAKVVAVEFGDDGGRKLASGR